MSKINNSLIHTDFVANLNVFVCVCECVWKEKEGN